MVDLNDILNRCVVGPQDGRELTVGEATIVLELAEIGRLAVELRAIRNRKPHYDRPLAERVKHDGEDLRAYHECSDAANAFLAQHAASAKGFANG